MSNINNNPWESANDAQIPSQHYFGELTLDMWFCVLVKGEGKVAYDPVKHAGLKRFTAIDLSFFVPNPNGEAFNFNRRMIAESKEWAGIILPSIHGVGLTPMTINKKWCHVEMVKTGTYTDKKTGDTKESTMPRIIETFDNEQACLAAAAVFFGRSEPEEQAFDHTAPAINGNAHPAAANEPNLATVQAFVGILAPQATSEEDLKDRLSKAGLKWESDNVQQALAAYRATKQVA